MVLCVSWVVCVLLLGWQLFTYLKDGIWIPSGTMSSLGDLLSWRWAKYPESWFGLHEVLEFFNFGFTSALIGSVLGAKLISFEDH